MTPYVERRADDQDAAREAGFLADKLPDVGRREKPDDDRQLTPEALAEAKALIPEIAPHVAPVALSRWERFCRLLDL